MDGLSHAIVQALGSYSHEINAEIKQAAKKAAKRARQDISETSPKRTGDYSKGWREKTVYDKPDDTRIVVHNPKKYRLTHLLELGYVGRDGKRVKSKPHIKQAEEKAIAEFGAEVERIVKG